MRVEVSFSFDWYWTLPALGLELSANLKHANDCPRWLRFRLWLLFAWITLHIESKRVVEVCPNCDCPMPEGCEGQFKDDGVSCLLNRTALGEEA
jgi:hypothetical protein